MKAIVDQVGRTVIGEVKDETKDTLTLINPTILLVQPNPQTNQLQVQTFPYMFMEFIEDDKKDSNTWTFDKKSIAVSDVLLKQNIIDTAKRINTPQEAAAVKADDSEPVKLFKG